MNTARRNERTETLMASYRDMAGSDPGDQLSDMLADLMHWAQEFDTFDAELARARYHYEAERE